MSYNTNDYMYAVDRSDDYLAHYGIKGMKWGVRKAIAEKHAARRERRLSRVYKRASKKLARLEKRAASGKNYARRAAALGAGAAAAGGLAAAGTGGVSRAMKFAGSTGRKALLAGSKGVKSISNTIGVGLNGAGRALGNNRLRKAGTSIVGRGNLISDQMRKASNNAARSMYGGAEAVNAWGRSTGIGSKLQKGINNARKANPGMSKAVNKALRRTGNEGLGRQVTRIGNASNNTYARIGAGVLGAGLAAGAGYNAYRAATTKRAAKKAAQWRSEMNKAFAGTKYANGGGNSRRRRRRR